MEGIPISVLLILFNLIGERDVLRRRNEQSELEKY